MAADPKLLTWIKEHRDLSSEGAGFRLKAAGHQETDNRGKLQRRRSADLGDARDARGAEGALAAVLLSFILPGVGHLSCMEAPSAPAWPSSPCTDSTGW